MKHRPNPLVSRKLAAIFGGAIALASVALVVPLLPLDQQIREGDIAPRTLAASHGAQYTSDATTAGARDLAAQRVPDVPLPLDTSILDRFLDQVRGIRVRADLSAQQKLDQLATLQGVPGLSLAGRTALLALDAARFDGLQQRADSAVTDIMSRGPQKADLPQRVDEYLAQPGRLPDTTTANEITALREVLKTFTTANYQVDTAATQRKRDEARANVSPIVKTYTRGQVIVGEGDRINAEAIEALRATGVVKGGFDLYDVAGGTIVAVGLGLVLAVYTWQFQPFPRPAVRRMALVGIALIACLAAVRLTFPAVTPDSDHHFFVFALPVAAAAMITAAFADLTFAVVVAAAVGLFAAFVGATLPQLAGASFTDAIEALELAAAYTASGLAGAVAVHRAERLSRYALAGLLASMAGGATMLAFWLISAPHANSELGWLALAAASNGFGSAVAALGALVLLAMVLGVTTRLQLMELAQAEHPLLRRLQDEAPGTYHHSMMVGALAERGAAQIGADALIARAGSYYHDIGKLARPGHYIENMLDGAQNPHELLTPVQSAGVIRDHVSDGLEVARRYRLPGVIRDFIPQHHGTRLVSYFYRRAVQAGGAVDPQPFRYSGPKPQTREAAVVMLADSCEAVVRASQGGGTPEIDQLVDAVFAERLAEGQLDECDITLRELQALAASFKATLRAVYHPRVAYPDPTPEELAGLARGEIPTHV